MNIVMIEQSQVEKRVLGAERVEHERHDQRNAGER